VTDPYELATAAPARRALADRLPHEVAASAVEFITGPLLKNPQRVGKALSDELVESTVLGLAGIGACCTRSTTASTRWSCSTSGPAQAPTVLIERPSTRRLHGYRHKGMAADGVRWRAPAIGVPRDSPGGSDQLSRSSACRGRGCGRFGVGLGHRVLPRLSVDGQDRPRICAVLAAQLDVAAASVVLDPQPVRLVALYMQDPAGLGAGRSPRGARSTATTLPPGLHPPMTRRA